VFWTALVLMDKGLKKHPVVGKNSSQAPTTTRGSVKNNRTHGCISGRLKNACSE